jgi:hypothetical protein
MRWLRIILCFFGRHRLRPVPVRSGEERYACRHCPRQWDWFWAKSD